MKRFRPTVVPVQMMCACLPFSLTGAFAQELPSHAMLRDTLQEVVAEDNGGFGFHMRATLVDRDGVVRAVTFSGHNRGDQWPGSRLISAQKANTANAFSLPSLALSTANLYSAVQPGGSLYGLPPPVNTENGTLLGALGVSGDSSCADHNIAWKVRDALGLDHLPGGVSPDGDDNIVYDIVDGSSEGGYGHPVCGPDATAIAEELPSTHPIGAE